MNNFLPGLAKWNRTTTVLVFYQGSDGKDCIQPAHHQNRSHPIGAARRCSTALSTVLQYLDDVVNLSNNRKKTLVPPWRQDDETNFLVGTETLWLPERTRLIWCISSGSCSSGTGIWVITLPFLYCFWTSAADIDNNVAKWKLSTTDDATIFNRLIDCHIPNTPKHNSQQ